MLVWIGLHFTNKHVHIKFKSHLPTLPYVQTFVLKKHHKLQIHHIIFFQQENESAGVRLQLTSLWFFGGHKLGQKKKKRSRFHKFLRCSHVESLFMCGVKVCEPLIQTTWLLLVVRRCERGGMEPCQRTACRQESWASTVGYLSSPSASDDVAISSVSATCTSSDLILCTTNHTGRKSTTCLSALRTRKKTRGDGPACAAIYLLQL